MYKKVVGKMRKDQSFYGAQPILGRGLKQVIPSFDLAQASGKKYAAYPIIKAYQTVSKATTSESTKDLFYTFYEGEKDAGK